MAAGAIATPGKVGEHQAVPAEAEPEVGPRSAQQRNNCSGKTPASPLPWPPGLLPSPHTPAPGLTVTGELCSYSLCAFREVSRIRVKLLIKHEQVPVMVLLQHTCFHFVPSQLTEKYISSLKFTVVKTTI